MITEIARCYADALYLKTMLRLPPHFVATPSRPPEHEPHRVPAATAVRGPALWRPRHIAHFVHAALPPRAERRTASPH